MDIPRQLTENAERVFGDKARAWLPQLPDIATRCREKWDLVVGSPAPHLSMNYIELTSTVSGYSVALKIGVPHDDLFTEMEALRVYDGRGSVRFVGGDSDMGAILMEQVEPGTMLWQSGADDEEQTRLAGAVMRNLPMGVPAKHTCPRLEDQVERAFAGNRSTPGVAGVMPEELLVAAEDQLQRLLAEQPDELMLHGDLHHENILLDEQRGWLAIDPKGVIGPRAYQPARFLNNRLPEEATTAQHHEMTRRRLDILSGLLDCPSTTLATAAFVDRILGTVWSLEDEGPFDARPGLSIARMLQEFL